MKEDDMEDLVYFYEEDGMYNYEDIHEAIINHIDQLDNNDLKVGYKHYIYQGTKVPRKASDYSPRWIIDLLEENANEDCPEDLMGTWPSCPIAEVVDLAQRVKAAIDKRADETDNHPPFYFVKDIKKIVYEITYIPDEEGYSADEVQYSVLTGESDL